MDRLLDSASAAFSILCSAQMRLIFHYTLFFLCISDDQNRAALLLNKFVFQAGGGSLINIFAIMESKVVQKNY